MKNTILLGLAFIVLVSLVASGCKTKTAQEAQVPNIVVEDVPKDSGDSSMPKADNTALIDKYADTSNVDTAINEIKQIE